MKALRLPFLLFALPALWLAAAPSMAESFLCDRSAIWRGEIWRLWTGHWVHFSVSHLGWNLAVITVLGYRLEQLQPGLLLRHVALAAPGISLALLAWAPAMEAYGGLSALATGLALLVALQLIETRHERALGLLLLALLAAKLLRDALAPASLFVDLAASGAHPATSAHLLGAAAAAIHWLGHRALRLTPLRSSARACSAQSTLGKSP